MMYSKFLSSVLFVGSFVGAQYKINVNDISYTYEAKINVENCSGAECSGRGSVELVDKFTKKSQTFTSSNLIFHLKNEEKLIRDKVAAVDADFLQESPLIIDDFNFDGIEDVAIRNGNKAKNGTASYDVYVYNNTQKKFVPNVELTDLSTNSSAFFEVDKDRERLIVYSKSGNSQHSTTEYTIMPNRGLVKVYDVEEDARSGDRVKVSTSEFKDDKWITTTKDYPIDEYYKK